MSWVAFEPMVRFQLRQCLLHSRRFRLEMFCQIKTGDGEDVHFSGVPNAPTPEPRAEERRFDFRSLIEFVCPFPGFFCMCTGETVEVLVLYLLVGFSNVRGALADCRDLQIKAPPLLSERAIGSAGCDGCRSHFRAGRKMWNFCLQFPRINGKSDIFFCVCRI